MASFAKSRHDGRWVWGMRTGTCVTLPPPWESDYDPQAAEHMRAHEGSSWTCSLSVTPAGCAQEESWNVPGLQIGAVWVF